MKLIVGLGNPGKEYVNTRHNIGFMVIDSFCEKKTLVFKEKYGGLYAEYFFNNEKIILLKPQNYMNLSGGVVYNFINYYNLNIEDIFIIYDDISFDLGNYKLKKSGSSGGHNGIKDIINSLKTEEIKRLRIGISKGNKNLQNYVLGKFGILERSKVKNIIELANNIIEDYMVLNFEKLMQKYNGKGNEN